VKTAIRNLLPTRLYLKLAEILALPFFLLRIFPISSKKIVFCNFDGKGYGDNPKYLANEILDQGLNLDLVWLASETKKDLFPDEIRVVDIRSIRAIFELVTARIWVDNSRKPFSTRKRNGQYYIQTWHAGLMLKRVEKDAQQALSDGYLKSAINDSRMVDLCISNGKFYSNFYRESFWYNGNVLECGFPKMDLFFGNNQQKYTEIKAAFDLPNETKIVLYAPTFRNNYDTSIYNLDFERILISLKSRFGDDWIFLVRLHPAVVNKSEKMEYSESVLNVSNYNDVQELMLISDVLITDYSSTMFEFGFLKRPVFIFAADIESFRQERGTYFEFEDLPFSVARNIEELCNEIERYDHSRYEENVADFMSIHCSLERGTASKQIVNHIKFQLNLSL